MAKILYFLGGPNQSLLNDGTPNAGGSIQFFEPGTTTETDTYPTYDDAVAGTNANANPVVLDAYGRADIWISGAIKFQVYDADDVAVGDPVDDFNGEDTSVGTATPDETNLITNGSFESWTGTDPDNITVAAYSGATVSEETSDVYEGASAIKIVAAGSGGATLQWTDYMPTSPGYEYLLQFMIENATGTTNIVRVKWYDEAKVALTGGDAYTDVYNNTTTHATWTRNYGFLTPPAGAFFGRAYAVGIDPSGTASGTVRFDGFHMALSARTLNTPTVVGLLTAQASVSVGDSTHLNEYTQFHVTGPDTVNFRCVGMARGTTGSAGPTSGTGESACGIFNPQLNYAVEGAAQLELARSPVGDSYSIQCTLNGSIGNSGFIHWEISGSSLYIYTRDTSGALKARTFNVIIFEHGA